MTPEEKRALDLAEIDAMSERIKKETAIRKANERRAAGQKAGNDLARTFYTIVIAAILFVILSRNETAILGAINAFVEWAKHG